MVLTLLYEDSEFINPQVVTAVTAAEAMHAALVANRVLPRVRTRKKVKRRNSDGATVQAPSEGEDGDAMGGGSRGKRGALAMRLSALATGQNGQAFAGLLSNPTEWGDVAADSRNSIAHGRTADVPDVATLHAVVETCKALVTLRLLERLGFTENDLRQTVTQSRDLLWVTRLTAEQFPSGDVQ